MKNRVIAGLSVGVLALTTFAVAPVAAHEGCREGRSGRAFQENYRVRSYRSVYEERGRCQGSRHGARVYSQTESYRRVYDEAPVYVRTESYRRPYYAPIDEETASYRQAYSSPTHSRVSRHRKSRAHSRVASYRRSRARSRVASYRQVYRSPVPARVASYRSAYYAPVYAGTVVYERVGSDDRCRSRVSGYRSTSYPRYRDAYYAPEQRRCRRGGD